MAGGIDTSFYPTAPAAQFNPLTTVQGYASAQATLQENQLRQQEIQGRMALGQAIQASTDPRTGVLNNNELSRRIAANPAAAMFALQTQQEANTANPLTPYTGKNASGQPTPMQAPLGQVRAIGNPAQQAQSPFSSQDEIDKAHAHLDAVQGILTPLTNDPNLDQKKVINATVGAVSHPDANFNNVDAATTLSNLPHGPGGSPPTGDQLRPVVQQQLQKVQTAKAVLSQKYPSSQQIAQQQQPPVATGNNGQPGSLSEPPDQSTPGSATGLPIGFAENQAARQKHYLNVQDSANSVPQENAALNNILNISKVQGVPSGTMIGQMYETLASTGLAPKGIEDEGAQLKIIQNHAAQIALAGGVPGSNERLEALQNAKVGDKDLPQVIQGMVPYLLAVNQGKLQQARYYQRNAGDGTNPATVAQSQQNWTQNFDPRILEMKQLQSDPVELKKYIGGLSKTDKTELLQKYNVSKQLGLLEP